ncbi:uncharacterized protein LOC112082856 [Eutrema salsugineum]|uniref:uncharacterized protein LOC112082856 n=1 Tax=Eutrema salsugineum TaxID=72664 RepID=UPI000CED4962|nr:uncharacterized protein LOC112082856 [Eutrema salsugineum]
MLQLKEIINDYLRCVVGNGLTASFWFDYWNDLGPFISMFGVSGPRQLRIPLSSHVVQGTRHGAWHLPPARSELSETLQTVLCTISPPSSDKCSDYYLWRNAAGGFGPSFSSKVTWDHIRVSSPSVPWHKIIWSKEEIPRCSFIAWLAMLVRLPTRDRLLRWGMSVPGQCLLCNSDQESHEHIFFRCTYSSELWSRFAGSLWPNPPTSYQLVPAWIGQRTTGNSRRLQVLGKLIFQCIIYSLWKERNARVFSSVSSPVLVLRRTVDRMIRDRLLSFLARSLSYPSLLELYFQHLGSLS